MKIPYNPLEAARIKILAAGLTQWRKKNRGNTIEMENPTEAGPITEMREILIRLGGWPTKPQVGGAALNAFWRFLQQIQGNEEFLVHCHELALKRPDLLTASQWEFLSSLAKRPLPTVTFRPTAEVEAVLMQGVQRRSRDHRGNHSRPRGTSWPFAEERAKARAAAAQRALSDTKPE